MKLERYLDRTIQTEINSKPNINQNNIFKMEIERSYHCWCQIWSQMPWKEVFIILVKIGDFVNVYNIVQRVYNYEKFINRKVASQIDNK